MSYQAVHSGIVFGVSGQLIRVEVELQNGLPYFAMVGYLSKESMEARERVASALRSLGHPLPAKKITVNLSPAQIRKSGTAFDFPIAVAFLATLELIPKEQLKNVCVLGELGLNGQIRGVGNCLPIVMEAKKQGIKKFFVSREDKESLQLIEDVEIIYMDVLADVLSYFQGTLNNEVSHVSHMPKIHKNMLDFSDVKGQEHLKRAMEIAVNGKHHMLIIGSPGCGKTMLSQRIATILQPLTKEKQLEIQSIYEAAGVTRDVYDFTPPVRRPAATITRTALLGGGHHPKAGEVTLAHEGVLILDEFLDFKRECIEGLKQCMEERKVTITRLGKTLVFPADFQLIATANPCPCGHALEDGKCRCTYHNKQQYLRKLSGSILDRFDMVLTVTEKDESLLDNKKQETSVTIRNRIIKNNCSLLKFEELSKECKTTLEEAYKMGALSRRGIDKIIGLAHTIASIEKAERIQPIHLMEAMTYRNTHFISEVTGYE